MIDPGYDLQVAIAAALLADSAVTGLLGQAILDPLSAVGAAYPLAEIGEDQVIPGTSALIDEVWSTVHVWQSGSSGRLFVKQAADAIRAVLAPRPPSVPALVLEGFSVVSAVLHTGRYLTDGDPTDPGGAVAHANLQFRFQLAPTA